MKIRLLGTSGPEGIPGLFCSCILCRDARNRGGRDLRTRTSALIDGVLKIDFPPDTLCQTHRDGIDLSGIGALLLTHSHDDHICAPELQYLGEHFVEEPQQHPLRTIGPADLISEIRAQAENWSSRLDLVNAIAWEPADAAGYTVTPVPANHSPDRICFNYIIQSPMGSRLLYAVDTGWYPDETLERLQYERLDAAVIECGNGRASTGYSGHLTMSEGVALRDRLIESESLPAGAPVAAVHFSHKGGMLHHELTDWFARHQITAAWDGFEMQVPAGPPVSV